jgi:hypothetical protein
VPFGDDLRLYELSASLSSQQFAANVAADFELDRDPSLNVFESVSGLLERYHAFAI